MLLLHEVVGIVFPTCVGVNREITMAKLSAEGIPHVCGGEPGG